MKSIMRPFFCLITFACLVVVSCAPATNKVGQLDPRSRSLASTVYEQANSYRVKCGSNPLKGHPGLNKLAIEHSEYMRDHRGTFNIYGKNITHMASESRALVAMRVYDFISFSENVAAVMKGSSDSQSASRLMSLWKNSPKHDAALRTPSFTHTGIGVIIDSDGTVFATQLFGNLPEGKLSPRRSVGSL